MIRFLRCLLPWLAFTRIALVFTAISNIWFVAFYTHQHEPSDLTSSMPLWAYLSLTALIAIGLYVFGMGLNDLLDARHDRTFAPARPLPSKELSTTSATSMVIGALLLALIATLPLGSLAVYFCLISALFILIYNGGGKRLPILGLPLLGLIRAMHMMIANPQLDHLWPIWLTFTHIVTISAIAYRLEEKRPLLRGPGLWTLAGFWGFVSIATINWMIGQSSLTDHQGQWFFPIVAVGLFGLFAQRIITQSPNRRTAGGLLIKWGLLWLIVYDASWLCYSQQWNDAMFVGALLPIAWLSMRLIGYIRRLCHQGPMPGFIRD